jgi:hypothetical protein
LSKFSSDRRLLPQWILILPANVKLRRLLQMLASQRFEARIPVIGAANCGRKFKQDMGIGHREWSRMAVAVREIRGWSE